MKNMRWLLALMLVLAVMLAGCAESAEDVAGNVAPNQAATEAAEEKPVSLGRMDGGVYTNSYAGFGCTLDDSWTFYSAEELQALPENVNEVLKDTEIGDAMEGVEQITDMMAENMETFSSMNLLYQKMDAQTRLVYGMMSEESIADAMLAQSDTMIAAYAQAGMDVTSLEKVTVTFLGEERIALRTEGTMQDIPFYMVQVFDYNQGSYSITLTMTSYMEDKTADMLALFYEVE
ncbi:MAG: hypothetical protein U0L15_07390 [Oscillospiraceae bacterium]|nr:hypothetical protein [Oscillospiraceae bacterium]